MIAIVVLLIALAGCVYAFIPSSVTITDAVHVKANANAVRRNLARQDIWDQLSPVKVDVTGKLLNGAAIKVASGDRQHPGQVISIAISSDSCIVDLFCTLPPSDGPLERLTSFMNARRLKNDLQHTLANLRNFCQKDSNLYGIHIVNLTTTDTSLLATRFVSDHYPSTAEVYEKIDRLNRYAATHSLSVVSPPLLNATLSDSNKYKCMVAMPIDRVSDASGDIFFVRMVPGRFLTTELSGGTATIQQGHQMIATYIQDYKKLLMAMPFEQILTDRRANPDTTQWLTRLYYPVPPE